MKATAILLLFFSTALQAACLSYNGTVEIVGKISRHTFPEQPGYESIAAGDAAASYFFVSPMKPFCVAEGGADDNEPAENGISRVQLVFAESSAASAYKTLRPSLGSTLKCTGTLFHAITGHHHSPVLLGEAKCNNVRSGN